jgi:hypothetical protein
MFRDEQGKARQNQKIGKTVSVPSETFITNTILESLSCKYISPLSFLPITYKNSIYEVSVGSRNITQLYKINLNSNLKDTSEFVYE